MPMNCTYVGQKVIFESSLRFVAGSWIGDCNFTRGVGGFRYTRSTEKPLSLIEK